MIGIDTFSWFKLIELFSLDWKNLIYEIISKNPIFITHDVKEELDYRFSDETDLFKFISVFPRLNISFQKYLDKGFDNADASLLEYAEIKDYFVITEDHSMLQEGITSRIDIIQLAEFFSVLLTRDIITKKEYYHLIKFLRKMKNITKKKEKGLLRLRSSFHY
ncbi:MAG: hypothetical protein HeimC3_46540 [Candidatus Heimdallarchaeota archaeon LC_3]|nr:MAG: hypothetical protein HeimC3_46540 [Candidatus Heimdallarchaeota archaeon LC_3]